jgi:hypothetical protein
VSVVQFSDRTYYIRRHGEMTIVGKYMSFCALITAVILVERAQRVAFESLQQQRRKIHDGGEAVVRNASDFVEVNVSTDPANIACRMGRNGAARN